MELALEHVDGAALVVELPGDEGGAAGRALLQRAGVVDAVDGAVVNEDEVIGGKVERARVVQDGVAERLEGVQSRSAQVDGAVIGEGAGPIQKDILGGRVDGQGAIVDEATRAQVEVGILQLTATAADRHRPWSMEEAAQ